MSLNDRFAELYELLIGVGVAIGILIVIAWLFGMSGTGTRRNANANANSNSNVRDDLPDASRIPAKEPSKPGLAMVAALYVAPGAGKAMKQVDNIQSIAGRGLVGDRYFLETGHFSDTDGCEVTIIAQEDIDEIEQRSDVRIQNGEHRRNIVTRNLAIDTLIGRRFYIGTAFFGYERPRPPCAYLQMITQPGMVKALGRHAGICARCIKSGTIRQGDQITILEVTIMQALKYRARMMWQGWQLKSHDHG